MISGLLLLGALARAETTVPLLDLVPAFEKGGRVLRNRVTDRPGIYVAKERYRGLCLPVPGRVGFALDAAFSRLTVKVGAAHGSSGMVSFRFLGEGRSLLATPPLFPGAAPLEVEVDLSGVLLFEIVAEGQHARGAVIDAMLHAAPGADLRKFQAPDAPFSPADYPVAFRRRVNQAIDDGAAYLLSQQRADGSWPGRRSYPQGPTALTLLALLKSGVKPDHAAVARGFGYLAEQPFTTTYGVSCLLMALEARYFPGGADEKDAYVERPKKARELISKEDRKWIEEAARWLEDKQGEGDWPVWRYPHGRYDLSNTQYALFGLSAANRCGVATPRTWLPALNFLLEAQETDGPRVNVSVYFERDGEFRRSYDPAKARGFSYTLDGRAYGSMTSAGLCSLILCRQALDKSAKFHQSFEQRTRIAIRDALAWMEEYYDVRENPMRGDDWWTYYLFNLERAGVLLDTRYIGSRDWYREGAEELLAKQDRDGSFGGLIDTCFAILFLKRATVPALTHPLR